MRSTTSRAARRAARARWRSTARRRRTRASSSAAGPAVGRRAAQAAARSWAIAKFGNLESLAGANAAIVTLPEAQRLTGLRGELNEIDVIAKPGVSPVELRDRIARALPASITVRTAQEQADEQAKNIKEGFSFINIALLVFAGIALFVGAFIIFNSFSMTVAQRMRELAMLRTLGASRRQILRSVVLEAALVGLVASVLGVLAGLGLAPGLLGLFKLFGLDLPAEGTDGARQRRSSSV